MKKAENAPQRSYTIDWTNSLFLGGYHLLLLILLPIYLWQHGLPSLELVLWTTGLGAATLLAITTGYHRLYSHRTYKTRPVVESVLLGFGTLATQGSALNWSSDHRVHHQHVDTEKDPYGTQKGFWHSHLLWMLKKRPEYNPRIVHDLKENRLLLIQHRFYGTLMTTANALAVWFLWWMTGDLMGAFVIGVLFRLFIVHHCTWFINSLAHMWGSKPYSTEHSAVNNFILAVLTFGEGYHNYHHTFASDYRNGVRWYQFDPPKYLIWGMSKLGLASDLKQVNRLTIKRKLVNADKHLLLDRIRSFSQVNHEVLVTRVESAAESLSEKLTILKTASDKYQRIKDLGTEEREHLSRQIRELKEAISKEMDAWKEMVHFLLEAPESELQLATVKLRA